MRVTKGTKTIGRGRIIALDTGTPSTLAALAWFDECEDVFEADGELVIEREYVRSMLDAIARKIVKEAIDIALPAIYAEEKKRSHPKNQRNPTGFRNSNRVYPR